MALVWVRYYYLWTINLIYILVPVNFMYTQYNVHDCGTEYSVITTQKFLIN